MESPGEGNADSQENTGKDSPKSCFPHVNVNVMEITRMLLDKKMRSGCMILYFFHELAVVCLNAAVVYRACNINIYVDPIKNIESSSEKLGLQISANTSDVYQAAQCYFIIGIISLLFHGPSPLLETIILALLRKIWNYDADLLMIIATFLTGFRSLTLIIVKIVFLIKFLPSNTIKINNTAMIESLNVGYKDDSFPSPGNAVSDTWNEIFIDYQCCAVNAVRSTTNDFDLTPWCTTSGSCQQTNSQIPKSCCKGVNKITYTSAPSDCHEYVNSGFYQEKGCAAVWQNTIDNFIDEEEITNRIKIAAFILEITGFVIKLGIAIKLIKRRRNKKIAENKITDKDEGTGDEIDSEGNMKRKSEVFNNESTFNVASNESKLKAGSSGAKSGGTSK